MKKTFFFSSLMDVSKYFLRNENFSLKLQARFWIKPSTMTRIFKICYTKLVEKFKDKYRMNYKSQIEEKLMDINIGVI